MTAANPKPFDLSVKLLILDERGRCLLLRRSARSRNHAGLWDFPGGKADGGESIAETAAREAFEETGLEIHLTRVAGAAQSERPDSFVAYLFFEARADGNMACESIAGQPSPVQLSGEHDAFLWAYPSELPSLELAPQFREFVRAWALGRESSDFPRPIQ